MEAADWGAVAIFGMVLLTIFLSLQRSSQTKPKTTARQIAVDGTNVLFWRDETAQISTLKSVLKRLRHEKYDPVVFLDASSRHHVGDTSLTKEKFAQVLGLPNNRIMVVPARTEADVFLLEYAGKYNLPVVSNDRFRDRPREARNIRLVKGHFRGKKLVLKGL